MSEAVRFAVDPKLATLLGEAYQSSERAIRELVDNAWDADAEEVHISLPAILSDQPITIMDDGSGMTEQELRTEYVKVARDRRTLRGDRTVLKGRRVRGRRGIGKFAGLMVAERMSVATSARSRRSTLLIERSRLVDSHKDFESIDLPFSSVTCENGEHGTTIQLLDLNRRLHLPNPEKLKRLLVMDYGRENDFKIFVNDERLTFKDIPGDSHEKESTIDNLGAVKLSFMISEGKNSLKHPGIVVKVNGKPIGEPSFFGLNEREDVPQSVLKRLYGEVEAPGLLNDVTADWSAVIENSVAYEQLRSHVQETVRSELERTFRKEFNSVNARIQQQIAKRLEAFPEPRRAYADAQLQKILLKLYGDDEEKIAAVVGVLLDALERDEYWEVLRTISSSEHRDVQIFADALTAFGFLELAMVGTQAKRRSDLLSWLDTLAAKAETKEQQLHQVIAANLWILGAEYALLSSNKTMRRVVEAYTEGHYLGDNASKRPDLLLLSGLRGSHLLIEFKRPSKTIDRLDESQAQQYRDDFGKQFYPMNIVLIGGAVDGKLRLHQSVDVQYMSYSELFSRARTELDWLVESLSASPVDRRAFFK